MRRMVSERLASLSIIKWNRIFIDAQNIIHKLKTRNKLNNLATFSIKPMNKPKGFLGQTINT